MRRTIGLAAALLAICACAAAQNGPPGPNPDERFEKSIRPILAERCFACHNPVVLEAGLDLTSAAGFRAGATTGPLVSPDDPDRSRLLAAVRYEDRVKMPPDGRLPQREIDALEAWVRSGARWPGASPNTRTVAAADPAHGFTDEQESFWAFQPMARPMPPETQAETQAETPTEKDAEWARHDVDRFIAAKLEENGLSPAPPADKLTLLRRVTYDLTGLPPAEQEIRDFIADPSESAFETVVERLLASPRYGERWGRHWLDVARYADSTGNDEDHRYPHAFRYRDYVIAAFNDDLPYDRFVQEQVAGDLLPAEDGGPLNRRGIVATGFLAVGPKALAQQDKKKMLYDVYDEQLDVVSKAFLGLTITCARCHDHNFDPIPTRDYYSMVGIFASTRSFADSTTHVAKLLERPLVPPAEAEAYRLSRNRLLHRRADIQHVVDGELARRNARLVPEIDTYMVAARRVYDGGEDAAVVAHAGYLDRSLLEKWARYLEPRDVPRPHMMDWHGAEPVRVEAVARAYRDRDAERVSEWRVKADEWWREVQALRPDMDAPPPKRPEVLAGTDRFFYDVHFHEDGPLAVREGTEERLFSRETVSRLRAMRRDLEELEEEAPRVDMASAIAEGDLVHQKVFLRGDYRNPGEDAPVGFLSILGGEQPTAEGSGRLELARWLTNPEQPLTARVMVNRVWQWHFGEGLVRTANNFGKMGEPPSHPELLDYLARRFVASGWSVKALHRAILHSSTYRMSSVVTAESYRADPENRLLSHFGRRRLDVEEIRDGLLSVTGALDLTMGGTLDDGTGTDLENSNERLSLDPAQVRRRMIYIPIRRANLPTLLSLFDFGDAVNSVAKRPRTTVAPQALFMMNSGFVDARSAELTDRLLLGRFRPPEARIETAYYAVINRPPTPDEIRAGLDYIDEFQNRFPGPGALRGGWQSFCKVLIASNEFIYVD